MAIASTLPQLERLIEQAQKTLDADNDRWERLACGQDSEQAEASGVLAGQVAGLQAALELLRGHPDEAEAYLDLHIEDEEPSSAWTEVLELRAACGYDPEADTGIDSLIAYKDALEDALVQRVNA